VLARGGALHVISTIKSALGEETQDRRHGAIGNRSITLRNVTNLVTLPDVGKESIMPHIHTDADPKSIAIATGLVGLGSHGHSR
jgi:hypothetical protein